MKRLGVLIVAISLAWIDQPALAQGDDARERRPRETRKTEKLSPAVYDKIAEAQEALDAKNLGGAVSILDALIAQADTLNNYEKAQVYNFYAAVHYEQGQVDRTIEDYKSLLRLGEGVPEQLRNNSLFRLAQLYFVKEEYRLSVRVLDQWMTRVDSVRPEAHMLKAQAYYQLDDFDAAEPAAIAALQESKQRDQAPREQWLALLRAIYYEQGDYPKAAQVLGEMIERWPNPNYYKQLAGMLGLMELQRAQLAVMHAAYRSGMLETESEILNMARLYMAEDAPNPAIDVLKQAMRAGTVDASADNLQLLAQAMSLAKEYEQQIPILQRAAELSGQARQYVYLGQAQVALYDWEAAAASLEQALDIGGLERPGSTYMQIGTAYYNLKHYSRARQAFKEAAAFADYRDQARQWITFVNQEVQRETAMRGG